MKNNVLVYVGLLLGGIVFGVTLLYGIGLATMPLADRVNQVAQRQGNLESRISDLSGKVTALDAKFDGFLRVISGGTPQRGQGPQAPQAPQRPPEDANKVYDIPDGDSIIIGKKDAPVTIVKFSDLQCPYCGRVYPALKEILKTHPDKVRLIIKHFPLSFHPNARPASKMAMAANEQGKYEGMVELLYNNGADVSEAKIKEHAQTLGLNYDKLMADLKANDAKYEAQIAADMALGGKVEVQGTPAFYVNGKKSRAYDLEGFKAEIESASPGK